MAGELQAITLTDPAQLVRELHSAAIALGQAKQRAQADPTPANLAALKTLLEHFRRVAIQYKATGAAGDLSWIDRLILETGQYVEAALAAIPTAIAYLPQQITKGLVAGLWPWLLGGAAVYWFVYGPGRRASGGMTWG